MHEISLSSADWTDPASEEGGQPGDHGHAHPHAHPDGTVSGGWHVHDHGAGHVHAQHNPAGPGNAAVTQATWTYFPQVFLEGTAIILDPSGPLYALIGSANLAAWADGTSNVGHAALSN